MALSSISSSDNIYYFRHRARRRVLGFVRFVIVFYVIYQIVVTMLLSSYLVESVSMAPRIDPGDNLLVSPLVYGSRVPFTQLRLPPIHRPRRGDVVLVRPNYAMLDPWYVRLADPVVRFFTGQRVGIGAQYRDRVGNTFVVKRVVGLPGDTLEIRDDAVYVKPAGSSVFSNETELIHGNYEITHAKLPKGWQADLPFSGNMAPITMSGNEYFVIGDNRADSSDSSAWGPVKGDRIVGKVIFRYWPLKKLGVL
ncbi:MAG TPA: signal peptidase I [Spirochaetia bacterium]|nr:signal peptidase I [Spirochaetia bacterium]